MPDSLKAIDKTAPVDEIRQKIRELNRTELEIALRADLLGKETGTTEALSALDQAAGGPTEPVVDPALSGLFDEQKVSIVGAALNGGQWYASFVLTSFGDFTLARLTQTGGDPALQTGPGGRTAGSCRPNPCPSPGAWTPPALSSF